MSARDLFPASVSPVTLENVARLLGYPQPKTVREEAGEKAAEDFDQRGQRIFDWMQRPIEYRSPRADALQAYAIACYSGRADDIARTEGELRDQFATDCDGEYVESVLTANVCEEDRL